MTINSIYENMVDRYGSMVYKVAITNMRNVQDAEDVFQDVFVRLIKYSPKFRNNEHEKAWLIRTTINCCHDLSSRTRTARAEKMENISVSDEYKDESLIHLVRRLPEKHRNVIYLFYYEDMPVKEIAAVLKQNENTVKSCLHRGRLQLKNLIEQGGMTYEI